MKKRKNTIRIAEPLIYALLVAGFGLITTFVNHISMDKKPEEVKFSSLTTDDNITPQMILEENRVSL